MILPHSPAYNPLLSYRAHLRYIALEGADGIGKTTQTRRLVERLNAELERGLCKDDASNAVCARQPTSGPIGSLIREMSRGKKPVDDAAMQLLFAADRMNAAPEIRVQLELGHHVITDRCELSSAVYYAASVPQFKCELCGWTGDIESTALHKSSKRWTYDDYGAQRNLVTVDAYRHQEGCDLDLTDVADLRFRRALRWNDEALHPGLVIVLTTSEDVAHRRIKARGDTPDLFEIELIQRRARRLYKLVAIERKRLRAFTRVEWVEGDGNEDEIGSEVFDVVERYLRSLVDDDRAMSDSSGIVDDHLIPKTGEPVVFEMFHVDGCVTKIDRPESKHRSARWLLECCPSLKATVSELESIPLGTAVQFYTREQQSYFVRRCFERAY
jgi:thymidylate kinase